MNLKFDHLNWSVEYDPSLLERAYVTFTWRSSAGESGKYKIPNAVIERLLVEVVRARRVKALEYATTNELLGLW